MRATSGKVGRRGQGAPLSQASAIYAEPVLSYSKFTPKSLDVTEQKKRKG